MAREVIVIRFGDGLYEGIGGAVESYLAAFYWSNWDAARVQLDSYRLHDPNCRIIRLDLPDDYYTGRIWEQHLNDMRWLNPIQKAIAFA